MILIKFARFYNKIIVQKLIQENALYGFIYETELVESWRYHASVHLDGIDQCYALTDLETYMILRFHNMLGIKDGPLYDKCIGNEKIPENVVFKW